MAKKTLSPKNQIWVDARKRYHLSHMHIQMARELGLNPKKFGKLANNKQEIWKATLPDFIETIYRKHFKKNRPDNIRSIEQMANEKRRKKAAKNSEKAIGTDEKMPEPALVADAFGRRQDSD